MTRVKGIAGAALVALTLVAYAPEATAKPKAIGSCQTITAPGSYVLTKSLTAVGTCLVIGADFVTIDLDGQTLTGDGTGNGISDGSVARTETVVRNGTITNFSNGIALVAASTGSIIEKVRAIGNTANGIVAGSGGTITANIASGNGQFGIGAGDNSTISGNTASGNGTTGISVTVGSTITGNTANGNTANGIIAGSGSTITGNTAGSNDTDGINAGSNNTINGNTASENGQNGIDVLCPSNVFDNTARANTGTNLNKDTSGGACLESNNLAP